MTTREAPPSGEPRVDARRLRSATRATSLVFAGQGLGAATWVSRLPQIRTHLHLDPTQVGLTLLVIALGGVLALPLSGLVIEHFGPRRVITGTAVLMGAALSLMAAGYLVSISLLLVGSFTLGVSIAPWDVAMNVHGAAVEQLVGRSVMSRFHAAFSVGAASGALLGTVMALVGVPVPVHAVVVAVLLAVTVPAAAARFLPGAGRPSSASAARPSAPTARVRRGRLAAWREPRTLLVGLVALSFALAEGAGNDWISLSVVDHHHTAAWVGTGAFTVFLTAMTAGRWAGPLLLDRWGRVAALRATAAVGVAGLLVFVIGPSTPTAVLGAVLWGIGASLGFPIAMSAGADDPALAAARVSTVASIGYCAFLGGPPLIGVLGSHVSVTHALLLVAVALGVGGWLAGATRPVCGSGPGLDLGADRAVATGSPPAGDALAVGDPV